MANNYDVVTLLSALSRGCVREEHLLLLNLVGFNSRQDGANICLYTPRETGTNTPFLSDFSESTFEGAWAAMLSDVGLEPYAGTPCVEALRLEFAERGPQEWLSVGVAWSRVVQLVLQDMPEDLVSHLDFQHAYWCEEEWSGQFGGGVFRVTRDAIHCSESPGQFFSRLDKQQNNADPVRALREQGAAVAVFRAADVPDDVDDPAQWLRVHANTIEEAMVRAGNETIDDLSIQLGLPMPGGH